VTTMIPALPSAGGQQETKRTILLVDDDVAIVKAWKRILELAGYRVVTASNGNAGLVAASQEKPDLIVTDRSMPAMEGKCSAVNWGWTKHSHGFLSFSPALTLWRPGDAVVWDEFWQKPVSLVVMVASVRRLLNASS
jgi:DNA-binding response OmpR family regulator